MKRTLLLGFGLLILACCATVSEAPRRAAVDDPTAAVGPEAPLPKLSDVLSPADGGAR